MDIAELSVRRPVLMVMVYILICVIALVFVPRLGIALTPDIEFPRITVSTSYPNVGPEEIDTNVTKVLTNQLTRIKGLKKVTSTSQAGSSRISLEFGYNSDLDEVTSDVESAIARVSSWLPDGCGSPSVFKFNMSNMPILFLAVEGDLPINELKAIAEDTVSPYFERVEGVASVDVWGGAAKEIRVDVSTNRLEAYGLSLSSIASALAARNFQLSSGEITQNGIDYEIITSEYYHNLDDIRQTILSTSNGAVIRVDDVATVYEQYEQLGREVYINGVPGLYVAVSNESGTNASTISKGIHAVLDTVNKSVPPGVKVSILSDNTTMIDATMNQVYVSIIEGIILAMLVIYFFLRNFKSTFIIGLSIPICFLITLLCMAFMDMTINLMTMCGLILGMGMVVDSSIVILENIYNRRIEGYKPAVAAILGSKNMINAIMASTLTTICVFIPMLIYKADLKEMGQIFYEAIVTIVCSLVSSLFVAVTLVPALCGSILKLDRPDERPIKFKPLLLFDNMVEGIIKATETVYVKFLGFCLKNRFIIVTMVIVMMIYAITQFASFGMNLSPPSDTDDQVNVTITLPIGTNKAVVRRYLFDFQDIVEKECKGAYKNIILNTGGSNSGSVQINLPELTKQTMKPAEIKAKLQPYLKTWSDATVSFSSGRGFGGGAKAIDVKLISNDTVASRETADKIAAVLKQIPSLVDVATDFEDGSPRYQLVINTEAAAASGVSVSAIAKEIRAAINGVTATTFYDEGNEYDIIVAVPSDELVSTSDIGTMFISTPSGRMSLDNFVTYKATNAPQKIQREDGDRVNHVTAGLAAGVTATEAQTMVEKAIKEGIVLPESVELAYGGDARDINTMGKTFIIIALLAIFLVFAVMAAQFESLVDPFIIFLSIPLLSIGVVAIYKITGQQFSLYSAVGVIALVGIVVNNGIVLVDYINQLVDQKIPVFDACLAAARSRLRPILMSTLTTVFGMVPMAFFPGEGAEQMQPVCITIVGGMMSGAFMTLFISPVMYTVFNKRREKRFNDPNALKNQLDSYDSGEYKNIALAEVKKHKEEAALAENTEPQKPASAAQAQPVMQRPVQRPQPVVQAQPQKPVQPQARPAVQAQRPVQPQPVQPPRPQTTVQRPAHPQQVQSAVKKDTDGVQVPDSFSADFDIKW
ncbi:MAG: efflux RND transporter permease subunit [Spirochaetaceae bacterium]|nr:efflux RND transporter permease subunit [Spirochaetaceae bacterium]